MTRRRSRTLHGSLPDDLGVGRHPHHGLFLLLDEQTEAVADVLQHVLGHVDRQARLGDGSVAGTTAPGPRCWRRTAR